jgi:ribonuclease R
MSPFTVQLIRGFKEIDIEEEDRASFERLKSIGAVENRNGIWRLRSLYRAGELYINKSGQGFLESLKEGEKELLIEAKDLNGASSGDEVVVKRIIARRGRASAKIVATIRENVKFDIVYINQNEIGEIEAVSLRSGLSVNLSL